MQRKEASQRVMAIVGATDDDLLHLGPDHRHDAEQVGGHARGPISLLIPREQVTGQRQAQHDQHQHQAEPEVDFARGPIGAIDDHLHQVERQQHDHGLREKVVHPAQQPAAGHFVLNVEHAFPSGLRTGTVVHPEKQAGDHLRDEHERERAAPHVAPAGAAGNALVECFVHQLAATGAMVQPIEKGLHPLTTLSARPL